MSTEYQQGYEAGFLSAIRWYQDYPEKLARAIRDHRVPLTGEPHCGVACAHEIIRSLRLTAATTAAKDAETNAD